MKDKEIFLICDIICLGMVITTLLFITFYVLYVIDYYFTYKFI